MKSKIFIAFGIMLCLGGTVLAAAGLEPGSSSDPLVTKSYVDSLVGSKDSGDDIFDAFQVANGKTLLGHAGTEIILRSGKAVVKSFVAADGTENGVFDATAGVDLKGGVECPMNHLLIVPRTDTRGITITSEETYVMVRGEYEIKNN